MRPTTTLFTALTALTVHAQIGRQELRTDTGTVVLHFFASGEPSTKEWMDTDDRWGRSCAYHRTGKEIFSYHTRKIGGHATARFSYHPNGGVSKVEVSNAPDGGIQWYKSTTTFDEAGIRTGFFEYGRDDDGIIPRLTPAQDRPSAPMIQQEAMECQKMFVNELFVVNPTKWTCIVTVRSDAPSPAMPTGERTIAPGDTLRIGTYSAGETFPPPDDFVRIFVHRQQRKNRASRLAQFRTDEEQVNGEHRLYFKVIDGWTNTAPIR